MTQTPQAQTEAQQALIPFFQAVREDVLMLALLHDRELDRDTVMGLWKDCYEEFLGLKLESAPGREALRLFRQGLDDIPTNLEQETLDILGAE